MNELKKPCKEVCNWPSVTEPIKFEKCSNWSLLRKISDIAVLKSENSKSSITTNIVSLIVEVEFFANLYLKINTARNGITNKVDNALKEKFFCLLIFDENIILKK
jgi:hypothetical protein